MWEEEKVGREVQRQRARERKREVGRGDETREERRRGNGRREKAGRVSPFQGRGYCLRIGHAQWSDALYQGSKGWAKSV